MRKVYTAALLSAAAISLTCASDQARSAEYGFGIYPNGSLAFGAGGTPPPGFYITPTMAYYQAKIGGAVNFGTALAVDVAFKGFTAATNLLYVPNTEFLGGRLGFSVNLPVGHVTENAQVTLGGLTAAREVSGWGAGDIMLRGQLGWTQGTFAHTIYVSGWVPTGRWEPGFAPIVGLHRPAADVTWGFTYVEPTLMMEFSAAAGVTFNVSNFANDYKTGIESHLEWAIGKKIGEQLTIGVAGYQYRQLTGDSGTGAKLGPFIGRNNGVGPALNYVTQIAGHVTVFSARHYWEYEALRHFEGNLTVASVTVRY